MKGIRRHRFEHRIHRITHTRGRGARALARELALIWSGDQIRFVWKMDFPASILHLSLGKGGLLLPPLLPSSDGKRALTVNG